MSRQGSCDDAAEQKSIGRGGRARETEQQREVAQITSPSSDTISVPPVEMIVAELDAISSRIEYLKRLIGKQRPALAQATDIKHALKTAHRHAEEFQLVVCRELGDDVEALAREITRQSWQSYRSAMALEEELKNVRNGEIITRQGQQSPDTIYASEKEIEAGVYIPTGATSIPSRAGTLSSTARRVSRQTEPDGDPYTMPGAEPPEVDYDHVEAKVESATVQVLRGLPHVISRRASIISTRSSSLYSQPQPREEVKRRIQQEEANPGIRLNDADRVRIGSCSGSRIASMVISGLEDADLVLPYLHYIKVHELRALVQWLACTGRVTTSGSVSCLEKVLHCIQLLQTGCRYESLAVLFSRSPNQIKESCREVMGGLLFLHSETVNKAGEQEVYMPLWRIWRKYEVTQGRAGVYCKLPGLFVKDSDGGG